MGTQISKMTPATAAPVGAVVPFVAPAGQGGLDPTKNYILDIGGALASKPSQVATLALLKALDPAIIQAANLTDATLKGGFTWTLGNYTGLADDINVVEAESTPLTTGAWVRQASASITHAPLGQSASIATKGFLDRFGYWAEDSAGIQQANDLLKATGDPNTLNLPPQTDITISATRTIDASFVSLVGNRARLVSSIASGPVIDLKATAAGTPYDNNQPALSDLLIDCNNVSGGIGLRMAQTGTGPAIAHLTHTNLQVRNAAVGIQIGQNAYIQTFIDPVLVGNAVAFDATLADNSGENLRIFGGTVADNALAFRNANPNAEINIFGTSIDYNTRIAAMTGGRLNLTSPHVELRGSDEGAAPGTTQRQFVLTGNGTGVIWHGGERRVSGALPHLFDYWVDAGAGTFYEEDGVFVFNDRTSTNTFATGAGSVQRGRLQGYTTHENNYKLHASRSKVIDPGFTDATVPDDIFIVPHGGDYTVSTRLIETHAGLGGAAVTTLATDTGRLKYSKGGGSGFYSAWYMLLPIDRDEIAGGEIFYAKPGANTGSFFFSYGWARRDAINPASAKVPAVTKFQTIGTANIVLASGAVASTQLLTTNMTSDRAPHWATHFAVTVNGGALGVGDVFFTAPNFDRMM